MSFEFVESITLVMPDVKSQMGEFSESEFRENNKLIVEIAAIHAGLTSNYNMYTAEALQKSLASWVTPYAKPIILNHDEFSDSVGRVMASRMDKEEDGTPFVRLQVGITDPLAVQKVSDQRFLTGSVGGSAKSAKCSICGIDWAKENMSDGAPCRHRKGKVYEGKLAYFELGELSFKEYSFVNVPADQHSGVRGVSVSGSTNSDESEEWTHTVKMYSLDMNNQAVREFSESAESVNILERMKKKEAQYVYTNLKGTFLSVSALEYKENDEEISEISESSNTINNELDPNTEVDSSSTNDEKSLKEKDDMSENEATEATTEEDDILDVAEQLNADLAEGAEQGQEDQPEESISEEADELSESSDVEADTEESEDADAGAEEVTEETEQLDESLTAEEGDEEVEPAETEDNASDTESEEAAESTDEVTETEEGDNDELVAENARLKDENTRLRAALHRQLAARVVDTKIALGVEESTNRAELLAEHEGRSASSLADSLRDLARYPRNTAPTVPTQKMDVRSLAVGSEDNVIEADASETEPVDPEKLAEEKFIDYAVDSLMGRKRLN